MRKNTNTNLKLTAIRGATTADDNTEFSIKNAVIELVKELICLNDLKKENIISITFTVTKDLTACFPASIVRKHFNFDLVSFLDCQQMFVANDINLCIRLMALVNLNSNREPVHPYLKGSSILRPDR